MCVLLPFQSIVRTKSAKGEMAEALVRSFPLGFGFFLLTSVCTGERTHLIDSGDAIVRWSTVGAADSRHKAKALLTGGEGLTEVG